MANHNQVGKKGEGLAAALLQKKGYSVLELNWRNGKNEIDIIAQIGDVIVFVEVKTRSTAYFGEPSQAVSIAKQQRLIQAANNYLKQHDLDLDARFDVISVIVSKTEENIDHIEDAFYPLA